MSGPICGYIMITLHPTLPSHADVIAALLNTAFGPGFRARTAERLRENNTAIAALAYIARDQHDALVGSISYWPVRLGRAAGLLLGPLAVDARVQGKGVGVQLMQTTLDLVDPARFAFVILVGDLDYYARMGFATAPAQVHLPGPVDPARLLIRADESVFEQLSGTLRPAPELC